MNSRTWILIAAIIAGAYFGVPREATPVPDDQPAPAPAPSPAPKPPDPKPPPSPKRPRWPTCNKELTSASRSPACPCGECCQCLDCTCGFVSATNAFGEPTEGGSVGPDGKTVVACDLPTDLRAKNVGGRDGAGLCVFTSIMHSARYQNERRLWDFQAQMKKEPGGGYPEKVDRMVEKYGRGTQYVQHQGGDLEFLFRALQSGRMPSVTYSGRDPHYGRQRVSHMVNLVHLDPPGSSPRLAAVLDNNYVGETQLVWMTAEEFVSRWKDMSGGWAVVLLAPPPPPVPKNQ